MSDQPSIEDIKSAVKASGYLMEQEVASRLEDLGFHVRTNQAFQDSDENKSREIDVVAFKRISKDEQKKVFFDLEFICECKNSNSPLVFINRPKNNVDKRTPPSHLYFPIDSYEGTKGNTHKLRPAFFRLGLENYHHAYQQENKCVQFSRVHRKGKNWIADHGSLYDSIFYPLAKAVIHFENKHKKFLKGDTKYFHFIFPIVVVNNELYEIDATDEDVLPKLTKTVHFKRQMAICGKTRDYCVDFVTLDGLPFYINEVLAPLFEKVTELMDNEMDMILTKKIPWWDD